MSRSYPRLTRRQNTAENEKQMLHSNPSKSYKKRNIQNTYIFYYYMFYPTPIQRSEYHTGSIFKWHKAGLTSEFSFS